MNQGWLSQDPGQNRSLLQMGLFDEDLDDPVLDDQLRSLVASSPDLGDDLEEAIHSGAGAEIVEQRRKSVVAEPLGPDLDLNDENLVYFRHVGVRDLLAEMVVQTIRDMIYTKDSKRMERLLKKNPEEHEGLLFSANWLSGKDGQLAVQMLYPDWDHVTILRRIEQDPQGIMDRMTQAGERRARERSVSAEFGVLISGEKGGGGHSGSIKSRLDAWSSDSDSDSDSDFDSDCADGGYGFRQG